MRLCRYFRCHFVSESRTSSSATIALLFGWVRPDTFLLSLLPPPPMRPLTQVFQETCAQSLGQLPVEWNVMWLHVVAYIKIILMWRRLLVHGVDAVLCFVICTFHSTLLTESKDWLNDMVFACTANILQFPYFKSTVSVYMLSTNSLLMFYCLLK